MRRQYWVHPIYSSRLLKGTPYTLYEDLREHPTKFWSYFRMSVSAFDELTILGPRVRYKNTKLRLSIPPEERITVTIR
jgi:hypothetical protein